MLELTALVRNALETPAGKTREGEEYGGRHQVQVEVVETLRNGFDRIQVLTLGCEDIAAYTPLQGQMARIPVSIFARGGTIYYSIPKGASPTPARQAKA